MSRVAYWVAYTQHKPRVNRFGFFVSGFSKDDDLVETRHEQVDFSTEAEAVRAAEGTAARYWPTPFSVAGVADTEMEPLEVFSPDEVRFATALKASDEEKATLATAAAIISRVPGAIEIWDYSPSGGGGSDSTDIARLLRACAK